MSDELSEYEKARLARIRDNHAQLVALGLAKDDDDEDCVLLNCGHKKKRKTSGEAKTATANDVVVPPSTRTLRSRASAEHVQLSDEFALIEEAAMAEEERMERRLKRSDSRVGKRAVRTPVYYSELQASEIEAKQVKMLQAHRAEMERQRAANAQLQTTALTMVPFTSQLPPMPYIPQPSVASYARADRHTYYTQGEKAKCPYCNGIFVLKKNGVMRAHTCIPIAALDATDLLPSLA